MLFDLRGRGRRRTIKIVYITLALLMGGGLLYTAGAVIYDEGSVSSCENKAAIGNLRDFDWNFQSLWRSEAMKARRKEAKDGCFCTHESNSYYPSLPFNPKHLIQIKRLEREMKKASRELERQQGQGGGVAVKA